MLGEGYAASAALAIATTIARQLVEKGYYNIAEAGRTAHRAEVECLTGLGDVIALVQGGYLEIRLKPGAPGIGEVATIPLNENLAVITAKLSNTTTKTPRMLTELRERINRLGKGLVEKLVENPSIERFLELSHEFTSKLGIVNREVMDKIEQILRPLEHQGIVLGYYYKKNILVVVSETSNTATVEDILRKHGFTTLVHELSPGGIKVKRC